MFQSAARVHNELPTTILTYGTTTGLNLQWKTYHSLLVAFGRPTAGLYLRCQCHLPSNFVLCGSGALDINRTPGVAGSHKVCQAKSPPWAHSHCTKLASQ